MLLSHVLLLPSCRDNSSTGCYRKPFSHTADSRLKLQGKPVETQTAVELYGILSESDTDLRQPVALETQLLQDERMESDVGKSMLQLLQVPHSHYVAEAANSTYWS